MAFNGSGTFTLYSPGNPVVTGTTISSTWANNTLSDLATGLSTCVTKDGQTTTTARIPFAAGISNGSQTITAVAAGTATTHAATVGQLQSSAVNLLGTIAGTNTVTAVGTPTVAAYASGQTFRFIPANTNTGATTLNIDGLGAKNIYWNGAALTGGEIKQSVPATVFYDGTQFNLMASAKYPVILLAKSGAAVTAPANTSENTLATITIPANALGANGFVRFRFSLGATNNANTKTIRLRFSGGSGTQLLSLDIASVSAFVFQGLTSNSNSTSAQRTSIDGGNTGGWGLQSALTSSSIDTTAATTMVITAQKGTAGDTVTLIDYLFEIVSDGT